MKRAIIKVEDVESAIIAMGVEPYVDRLVQDRFGNYYWVECERCDELPDVRPPWFVSIKKCEKETSDEPDSFYILKYMIHKIPIGIAHFIIDALRLQSQVIGIGNGKYDGQHGGEVKWIRAKL